MYIWVLLTTFLAMLYSYNLSHRSDMREIEVEPVAKALISKLIIKQQSAGRYMRGHTPPFAQSKDAEGNVYKSDNITYAAGVITAGELSGYLPYGFKDDGSVTTEIYCLNKENTQAALPCSDDGAIRYLVAYMPIPQRWLNVKTGLPNNDFNNAMKQMIGYDSSFGYPSCEEYEAGGAGSCKRYAIRGREGLHTVEYGANGANVSDELAFELPAYIVNNGGFAATCKNKNTLCLIYIYEYKSKYYS